MTLFYDRRWSIALICLIAVIGVMVIQPPARAIAVADDLVIVAAIGILTAAGIVFASETHARKAAADWLYSLSETMYNNFCTAVVTAHALGATYLSMVANLWGGKAALEASIQAWVTKTDVLQDLLVNTAGTSNAYFQYKEYSYYNSGMSRQQWDIQINMGGAATRDGYIWGTYLDALNNVQARNSQVQQKINEVCASYAAALGKTYVTNSVMVVPTWSTAFSTATPYIFRVEKASYSKAAENPELKLPDYIPVITAAAVAALIAKGYPVSQPIAGQDTVFNPDTGEKEDVIVPPVLDTSWLEQIFNKLGELWNKLVEILTSITTSTSTSITNTESIKDSLSPDIPNISIPSVITTKFPFSIPWDVYHLFGLILAEPKAPHFVLDLSTRKIMGITIPFKIDHDMSYLNPYMSFFRGMILIGVCFVLAYKTKDIVGGAE